MGTMTRMRAAAVLVAATMGLAGGCESARQERALDMAKWTKPPVLGEGVQAALDRQPAAEFPASIAVVRVTRETYHDYRNGKTWGTYVSDSMGKPVDALIERCRSMPLVTSVTPLNRLTIDGEVTPDRLREAAAGIRADLLLVTSVETVHTGDDLAWPIGLVTLGLFPTKVRSTETSASLALIDTRTGYVYSMAEARDDADQLANGWTSEAAKTDALARSERRAGEKLVAKFEEAWKGVLNQHAAGKTPAAAGVVGK